MHDAHVRAPNPTFSDLDEKWHSESEKVDTYFSF
jgi:hypothetical protein